MTATVPLSQSELGELVGLHRQSINAALRKLEEQGHISRG
jgi:DNA-binding MarR family transcriptional regulator